MINTVISGITNALSKDFLFASFLPAILLMIAIGSSFAAATGWITVITHFEQMTSGQTALASTGIALIGIVTAYLLSALRGPFINFWSGESRILLAAPALVVLGERLQRRRFIRLRERAEQEAPWPAALQTFEKEALKHWQDTARGVATSAAADAIRAEALAVSYLAPANVESEVKRLAGYFSDYKNIEWLFEVVKRQIVDAMDVEELRSQKDAARLDREYGGFGSIRATRLGNIIESYNHYAHKRYRLEAEVFWPRLRKVIPEKYFEQVQEPKILLDFAVTMASISLVYAFAIALGGPWLWLHWFLSTVLVVWALLSTFFFYGLAVTAASQYGDMIRSCFDLFRLDLLAQLQLERPLRLADERLQWEKLSQLVVYGTELDLVIAPAKATGEE